MDPEAMVKTELKALTRNWCLKFVADKDVDHYYITLAGRQYPLPEAVLYETGYYDEAADLYYDMLPVIQNHETETNKKEMRNEQ